MRRPPHRAASHAVILALALCLAAWWSSVPLAVAAIIALGVGASFYDPIASAATPNLVDPSELASAQSLMGAVWGSMLMVGDGSRSGAAVSWLGHGGTWQSYKG